MAKKRTKKEKIYSQAKKVSSKMNQAFQYEFSEIDNHTQKKSPQPEKRGVDTQSFFGYDIHLVYKDLAKTSVVSMIVMAVLFIILVYT